LFTASVEVPVPEASQEQRTLLSEVRRTAHVHPETLLAAMTQDFDRLRATVQEIGAAWATVAERVERNEAVLAELAVQRALPSGLLEPELRQIAQGLDAVRESAATDPLGTLRSLQTGTEAALGRLRERVAGAERLRDRIHAARCRWETLAREHEESTAAAREATEKLGATTRRALPVADEKMRSLEAWIARLEQKQQEGVEGPLDVGIRSWNEAAEACQEQNRAAFAECRALLAERGELRGRLGALQAKAKAFGLEQAAEVVSVGSQAQEVLYTRPIDLGIAAELVARYERTLLQARSPMGTRAGR
jgi:hypothetical protein